MKKFLSSLFTVLFLCCLLPLSATAAHPFTDVKQSDWYNTAVDYTYSNRLLVGVSDTSFAPRTPMTRAMFVQALANRTENYNSKDYTENTFTDVPKSAWYFSAVEWAASHGIVTGVGEGAFMPNARITREQMAVILLNYAMTVGHNGDIDTTTDIWLVDSYQDSSSISEWAVYAMEWAVENKILSGTTATTLEPKSTATRAQVAQVFYNARNTVVNKIAYAEEVIMVTEGQSLYLVYTRRGLYHSFSVFTDPEATTSTLWEGSGVLADAANRPATLEYHNVFNGVIKGGEVIETSYENGNCTLIFNVDATIDWVNSTEGTAAQFKTHVFNT